MSAPTRLRAARLRATSFDADSNTIEVVWTTGAAVRRFDDWSGEEFDEVLSLAPGAVRLGRLNAGAPFIDTHDSTECSRVVGSVVRGTARIEDGKGVATIQLSRAKDVADIVTKIREGVIRNISVGYWIHKSTTEDREGGVPLTTATDWEPLEISAVPVPADPGSQVRSASSRKAGRSAAPVDRRSPGERAFDEAEAHWARIAGKPIPTRTPSQLDRLRAALGDTPASRETTAKAIQAREAADRRHGERVARRLLRQGGGRGR